MISTSTGGEGGIRTPDTVSPVRRIQLQNSCASRDANCGHEIKLTESLAAPLLEETRRRFQEQMRRNMPRLIAAKIEAARLGARAIAQSRQCVCLARRCGQPGRRSATNRHAISEASRFEKIPRLKPRLNANFSLGSF